MANISATVPCSVLRSKAAGPVASNPGDHQLQQQIDAAAAVGECATLQALLTAANASSNAHEKATGYPNDALVAYIQGAQHQAGCPA